MLIKQSCRVESATIVVEIRRDMPIYTNCGHRFAKFRLKTTCSNAQTEFLFMKIRFPRVALQNRGISTQVGKHDRRVNKRATISIPAENTTIEFLDAFTFTRICFGFRRGKVRV